MTSSSAVADSIPAISPDPGKRPLISVVVEGYNEHHNTQRGALVEVLDTIQQQTFPLEQVELIITSSPSQVKQWQIHCAHSRFAFTVKSVVVEGHYWQAKNQGAAVATGEILVFTDSDVRPRSTWLSAIAHSMREGADASVGPSLFHQNQRVNSPWLLVAGSISWGITVGEASQQEVFTVASCLGHNLAVRADFFQRYPFRADCQRSFVATLLLNDLKREGKKVTFQPAQRVTHDFAWKWWLFTQRFRSGWETYAMRQLDETCAYNRAIARLSLLARLINKAWHVCLDVPQWSRYSRAIGLPWWQRMGLLPLLVVLSLLARGTEMVGMYGALLAPKHTEQWARF